MIKIDLTDNELIRFIGNQESQEILSFDALADRVLARADHAGLVGDSLPWSKTHSDVALGQGELSVWAGINGHGKTALLTQVVTHLVSSRKVLVASMEMQIEDVILMTANQSAGCKASKGYIAQWLQQTKGNGYVYNCLGKVPQERILGLVHYAGGQLGINHVVIDSLTMCGVGRENYEAQAQFVLLLRDAAKQYGIHVHLVCHMRKGSREDEPVGKFDIRGAGEISDLADKVFIVQRNKTRERQIALCEAGQPFDEGALEKPGTYLRLVKNRQDGNEAVYGLWFHKESGQFTSQEDRVMNLGAA